MNRFDPHSPPPAVAVAVAFALAVAIVVTFAAAARAAAVVAVLDGDTLIAHLAGKGQIVVRIAGIDAPESAQRHGRSSREHLAALVCGRDATLEGDKVDPFGRLVATVHVDRVDAGLEQIRAGLAWHFTRYAHEQEPAQRHAYRQAEMQAREREAGLWHDPSPEAPWSFRERQRRSREARPRDPQPAAPRALRSRDMC
ncbi:MAG: thermonuclease family protein [Burkholderiaceae bacterium]|nr:thermonuclease family protein [Burkholderiaceae bacterium]